jgi:transposase
LSVREIARRTGVSRNTVKRYLKSTEDPGYAARPAVVGKLDGHKVFLSERMADRVEQPVFDALKDRLGVPWLVELTAVTNFYIALCGVVNAFDVPVPPEGDRFDG